MANGIEITVGQDRGDIVGRDHRALQAAADYVGRLGGGTVRIDPGVYEMGDSLHLWSNTRLLGAGERTVLRKAPAAESALAADGDYGDCVVTVADPSGFEVGGGITLGGDGVGGFHHTVATVVAADGNVLTINGSHRSDYTMRRNAWAATIHALISGRNVENIRIESLVVDGNRSENPRFLNGCRGGGIYFHHGQSVEIVDCTVRDFNGDGISFQQSNDVSVLNCACLNNAGLGLHPGSGSQRPVIRGCRSEGNDRIGLFFCWRVRHGVAEDNQLLSNGETGLSIGHKDTDNLIQGNTISGNASEGILFRNELEPQGAHRNRVIDNVIMNNGGGEEGCGIRILGETHDLVIQGNEIGNSVANGPQRVGVYVGSQARDIELEGNRFLDNVEGDVVREVDS